MGYKKVSDIKCIASGLAFSFVFVLSSFAGLEFEDASEYEPMSPPPNARARLLAAEGTQKQPAAQVVTPEEIKSVSPRKKITPVTPAKKITMPALQADADEDSPAYRDTVNPAFGFTHMLPSPMNIPGGAWMIGSSVAYGVTDFLQLSTDVIRDAYRYWNVQAKVPLIEFPTFITSAYVSWDTFNLNNYEDRNPDRRVTAWQPGLVTGYELSENMAFFVGGNFQISKADVPDGIRTSGFSKGSRIEADWSWLYNPSDSRLSGNAITAGGTYDFTYGTWGVGVTHHWPSLQLGFHYTVNADRYRFMPIFAITSGFTF